MRNRMHIYHAHSQGERIANAVTGTMGSWRFIVIQTVVVAVWIMLNAWWLVSRAIDPYPFILLNLAFSTQAAYAAPLILMSQNRQSERDRARDDIEADEVKTILQLQQETQSMQTEIKEINLRQMQILELLQQK